MSDDDVALVFAIRNGSELAFNRLVDRHQQAVRTFEMGVRFPTRELLSRTAVDATGERQ